MMKRLLTIIAVFGIAWTALAQNRDTEIMQKLAEAKTRLEDFDTEHLLDSLDQEKLPKLVSGGVFGGGPGETAAYCVGRIFCRTEHEQFHHHT